MNDRYEEVFENAYVVLRTEPQLRSDPFAGPRPRMANVERMEISVDRMTERDLRRRSRDLSISAIAPVMPMRLIEPTGPPLTPAASPADATWGVEAVGALTSPFSGQGITVAVLDTGINTQHSAFRNKQIQERDFTGEGDGDVHGHGTHCAGTICGELDSLRIGVAPGVQRLLVGKVLGDNGGATSWISSGIQWAMEQGAHVISMSLGIDFPGYVELLHRRRGMPIPAATSVALQSYRATVRLMDNLAELLISQQPFQPQGTIVVAASGNESERSATPAYTIAASPPANADGFVAVGAIGQGDNGSLHVASFSNTGANVAAPGEGIISAWLGDELRSLNGTSMATPHAAGVAALWAEKMLAESGRVDSRELAARLTASASLPTGLSAEDIGSGLVQAPQS